MQYWKHVAQLNSPICLQPSPIVMGDFIRVFAGYFPNQEVIGHTGFFDYYPRENIAINQTYNVLTPGNPGTFDSFGVIPTCIVAPNYPMFNYYRMYYAGYQQLKDVRFCAFTGLATSDDGKLFFKYGHTPVVDRSHSNALFRVVHCVLDNYLNEHVFVGGGDRFIQGVNKTLPVYTIKYDELLFGETITGIDETLIHLNTNEHRVGRPTVLYENELYKMWYCYGNEDSFAIGYAEAKVPHEQFERKDDQIVFEYESPMKAYPAVIKFDNEWYMFYNIAYGQNLISEPIVMVAKL